MTTEKEEYLEAKVIVDRYELEQNKNPERSFLSGDNIVIKEGDTYTVVVFSNPEMTIVDSIVEYIFPNGAEYCNESYRCFSTKEKANLFISKYRFTFKMSY